MVMEFISFYCSSDNKKAALYDMQPFAVKSYTQPRALIALASRSIDTI